MSAANDPNVKIRLIGTGAVRANPHRGGPCQIVELEGERILVDCGRNAVSNLSRFGYAVEDINTVFVTHLHFDHVCDLAHFVLLSWNNGRRERLRFFGPPGLEQFLTQGVSQAYARDIASRLGHGKDSLGIEWSVTEIENDGPFTSTGGYELSALRSPHAGLDNLNLRVDTRSARIGITSDTAPADTLAHFYRDAELLVAECSGTREFLDSVPWGSWHLCPETLGGICNSADVAHVEIKHLVIEDWAPDPEVSEKMAAAVREMFAGRVSVGYDGLELCP